MTARLFNHRRGHEELTSFCTVPLIVMRVTWTVRVCPILCALSMACSSMVGFHHCSQDNQSLMPMYVQNSLHYPAAIVQEQLDAQCQTNTTASNSP
jgi:hypothetical protein